MSAVTKEGSYLLAAEIASFAAALSASDEHCH
jgi:hypothetical protein